MSSSDLIRWAGLAAILAGVLLVVGGLLDLLSVSATNLSAKLQPRAPTLYSPGSDLSAWCCCL
jgi:hypothetical protein